MIYKRGKVYWYKFMWQGRMIRESSKQGSNKVARQMESAHRASLAKGLVGIREKKPIPTLMGFCKEMFWPWVQATFTEKGKTWWWYKNSTDRILESDLRSISLDRLTSESVAIYVASRKKAGLAISSINAELRVLRRMLNLAREWDVLDRGPRVEMLPGEKRRERVVTPVEERKYLEKADDLLKSVAIVLIDTGLRPEECFRLSWEYVHWQTGEYGSVSVTHGKTEAARRAVPMTPRVRAILEFRHQSQSEPEEGWVWPARTKSSHIEPSSLKWQHRKALMLSKVRSFVLYSLRHTFLTRLGESGCDAWTLAKIAGHNSVAISQRYVHPSEMAVHDAMRRLTGHNTGHSADLGQKHDMLGNGSSA